MEVKDIFDATPRSIWQFMCETGQGFYVPSYQRQYSWDKSKIFRLFDDACHGVNQLLEREDSITFIGTIIAIHDTSYVTVSPLVRHDVPARVMTIIDGQQRLTTLLIINTVFHEEIKTKALKFEKKKESHFVWLFNQSKIAISQLGKTFEMDMDYGDGPLQYYPRMIRAYDDQWSREKNKAKYTSPIGRYLHQYGQHVRDDSRDTFSYNVTEGEKVHEFLAINHKEVRKIIKGIAKGEDNKGFEFPDLSAIQKSNIVQSSLINSEFPEDVRIYLAEETELSKHFCELLRLILLANFFLKRVAVTTVTAKNEDYAFDMFEALNTTGEPLTAFETFKPRVIASEALQEYEFSESKRFIDIVEASLETSQSATEKQNQTTKLLVPFRLAESGKKLSKRLNEQRRFLKDEFEALNDLAEKRKFLRLLAHTALFIRNAWSEDESTEIRLPDADFAATSQVKMCLDLLRKSGHTITIAPLVQFYSNILNSEPENRDHAINSFIDAIKAVTAFSVFWRSSRRGTDNIDSHYRNLMKDGIQAVNLQPLARRVDDVINKEYSSEKLKNAFRYILENDGKITSKEDWIRLATNIPAYKNQSHITRFILLAAAHDSVSDINNPGFFVPGKEGICPTLDFEHWRDERNFTVEHVAPVKNNNGWSTEIYEDPENVNVDKLGNLVLLPKSENSSLSNRSWEEKRLIYKVLSAETEAEVSTLKDEAKKKGIDFSESTQSILDRSKFLPQVKSISLYPDTWSLEIIEKRSNRIAELAWERLSDWLGYHEEP